MAHKTKRGLCGARLPRVFQTLKALNRCKISSGMRLLKAFRRGHCTGQIKGSYDIAPHWMCHAQVTRRRKRCSRPLLYGLALVLELIDSEQAPLAGIPSIGLCAPLKPDLHR